MGFSDYVLGNIVMLFELIGLLILLGVSVHISEQMQRLTYAVVLLLFAESAAFYLERWTQTFSHLSLLRPFLTACVYSLYPVILLLVTEITATGKRSLRKLFPLLIPQLIAIPLYFTTQWTHLICWFSDDNVYQGGVLPHLPHLLFAFYTLVFLIRNILYFRGYSRQDRLIPLYVTLFSVVIALYYYLLDIPTDYSALFTAALLLYYIFFYIHLAKVDPLTALLNRQSYYRDVRQGERTIAGVVSVDMNELKRINDTQGHKAGDEALQAIAAVLREHCGQGGSVYRVGGDEFVILYTGASEALIAEAVERMRQKLSETPYTCAFGCAMVTPGRSVDEAVIEADRNMYADKAAVKRAALL